METATESITKDAYRASRVRMLLIYLAVFSLLQSLVVAGYDSGTLLRGRWDWQGILSAAAGLGLVVFILLARSGSGRRVADNAAARCTATIVIAAALYFAAMPFSEAVGNQLPAVVAALAITGIALASRKLF
jgi:hypothetical protein